MASSTSAVTFRSKSVARAAPTTRVRRSATLIFAGNIGNAIFQWGMIVFLARWYDPETVGAFGLGVAVVTPLVTFSSMQLQTLLATDHRNDRPLSVFLSARIVTSLLAMLMLGVVVVWGGYSQALSLIILATGLAKSLESLSELCFAQFQKQGHSEWIAISLLLRGAIGLAALCAAMVIYSSLVAGVAATAVVSAVVLLLFDLPLAFRCSASGLPSPKTTRILQLRSLAPLLVLGFPLGLAMMLNSLNMNIPRYFLAHWGGEHALGIFVALSFAMRVGFYVETALSQAALPRMAKLFAENRRREFYRLTAKLLTCAAVAGLAGLLISLACGRQLLTWFYTVEYAEYAQSLNLLMVAAGVGYVGGLLKATTDATQTYISQLPLFMIAAVLSLIGGWMLIPTYGIAGAAIALIIARASLVLGYGGLLLNVMLRTNRRSNQPAGQPSAGADGARVRFNFR